MSALKQPVSGLSETQILNHISQLVTRKTGVQLGEKQKHMVESRLKKRVLEIGLSGLVEYFEYFEQYETQETQALISLLTTHHTYFFREFSHFEYLEATVIPKLIPEIRVRADKTLKVWSAACSRGQEVYSLAMFLDYVLSKTAPDLKYEILGTDIDPESVSIARNGVYHRRDIKEIPLIYLGNHWARGTGEISEFVKAKASLKSRCRFDTANLIDGAMYGKLATFDLIFCRNVFIYFLPEQIKQITTEMMKKISSQGYLFVGISETLHGLGVPVASAGPSIYTHPQAAKAPAGSTTAKPSLSVVPTPTAAAPAPTPARDLRVLCVDDSPSILTLMKAIFTKAAGFELVGTAVNGLDAAKKVQELKPDVITLDIHMPEQTGIEYLEKNFGASHPAVVMVSSVSRDNADLALRALEIGASDYIEKPALNQLKERTEEIRFKVRSAFTNRARMQTLKPIQKSVDQEFKTQMKIADAGKKLRLFIGQISDRSRIAASLKELSYDAPPSVILIENAQTTLAQFATVLSKDSGKRVEALENHAPGTLQIGRIYVADFGKFFAPLQGEFGANWSSLLVYGEPTEPICEKLKGWKSAQLLIEETAPGAKAHPLAMAASDEFPSTSFVALSQEFLSKGPQGGAKK